MNLQWFGAALGAVALLMAVLWARRVTRRLERLSQSYWELRYEHGQLSARLGRLEPPALADPAASGTAPDRAQQPNFVPLSSLRRPGT